MSEAKSIKIDIREFKIKDIIIGDRSRDVDEAWVEVLMPMIKSHGLINPITVWMDGDDCHLVAGLTRITAVDRLGYKTIPVNLSEATSFEEAKILEVAENIGRNELNAFDRSRHLYDLIAANEKLHPEMKKGGDKQTDEGRENLTAILAVRSEIAEQVGLSERAVRRDVAIWKGLTPASRTAVKTTWLARHQAGLQQLSAEAPKVQKKICDLLFCEKPKASNVTDALIIINKIRVPTHIEKKFSSINKALESLTENQLDNIFSAHEAKITAWIERRGK